MLVTHRGLSGPAMLQASSYWREGEAVELALAPDARVFDLLKAAKLRWKSVTILPTDDRLVPVSDASSNVRMLAERFLPLGARVLLVGLGTLLLFCLRLGGLFSLGGLGLLLGLVGVIRRVVHLPVGIAAGVFRGSQRLAGQFLKQGVQGGGHHVQQVGQKAQDIVIGQRQLAIVGGHRDGLMHHAEAALPGALLAHDFGGQLNGVKVLAMGNAHDRAQLVPMAKLRADLGQPASALPLGNVLAMHEHPAKQQ